VRDQAAELRRLMSGPPRWPAHAPSSAAAFVIGSGKGGVGKSALSVLLAAALARQGHRVLLFDGCQNQGNLHVLLGVRPAAKLELLLAGEVEPAQLLVPVAGRLWLLPGDSGAESLYGLTAVDRARLHHRLSTLYDRFDAVVIDSGPGIESVVRATMRASRLVVVTVPEPAALGDSYALIKIATHQVPSLAVNVLVNRVSSEEEGRAAFECLELAAQRFLRREIAYLGAVPEDDALRQRVRRPGGLLAGIPDAVATIAERLPVPVAAGPERTEHA